jgi:hypothetical protein
MATNLARSIMKLSLALFLCCSGYLVMPLATLAKQPVANRIGNIQNTRAIQGAGCSFQRKGDQGYVFWSAFENSALMNIDGKDRILKLVGDNSNTVSGKLGSRSTVIYKSGKTTVRIDRVATRVCRQGDQECESISYNGTLKLNIGDRQQVVAVEGVCGS